MRQDPERFKNPGGHIRTQIFAIEEEVTEQQPEPKAILSECFELFVPYLLSASTGRPLKAIPTAVCLAI